MATDYVPKKSLKTMYVVQRVNYTCKNKLFKFIFVIKVRIDCLSYFLTTRMNLMLDFYDLVNYMCTKYKMFYCSILNSVMGTPEPVYTKLELYVSEMPILLSVKPKTSGNVTY